MKSALLRKVGLYLCMLLSLIVLSSCYAFDGISEKGQEKSHTGITVVEVWTNNSSSKAEDIMMVNNYNNGAGKEKGIFIDYKIMGGEYTDTLKAALEAGEAPALFKCNVGNFNIPVLVKEDWVVPIEDIAGGNKLLEKYSGYLQPITNIYKGKTYTVTFAVTTMAVAYNKELLKKNGYTGPPQTWDELKKMAETITKNGKGKEFGFIEGLKSNIHSQNGLYQFVPSVGHNEFDTKSGRFNFSDFSYFYKLWADMEKEGTTFPGCEGLNNDQARAQFAEGNIGFKFSASYDVGVWKDQFPTKMDWGICRPVMDPYNRYKYYAYQTPSLVFGKKALEIQEKAMEVFKLWNSDETLVKLYEAGKYIPYRQDIIRMSKKKPNINNWTEFADMSDCYVSMSSPLGEMDIEGNPASGVIQDIIMGRVPAYKGLAELDRQYNSSLNRAISEGLDMTPYIDKDFNVRMSN